MKLLIKKIHPEAKVPNFAHKSDAAMDLYTTETLTVEPGQSVSFPSGIAMAIPEGFVGLIWDKSGVAIKRNIKTKAGVIDAGYRGEIIVGMFNIGSEPQTFETGDKIAQILIQKIEQPETIVVEDLDDTDRGSSGFGSTGR